MVQPETHGNNGGPGSRNVMLTISYDGTAYRGWQVQPNGITVQECVEASVCRLTGERLRVYCAGRTDSGVHALGQVANFHTTCSIPVENIRAGLQSTLPGDIVIVSAAEVSQAFHSTYSAVRKRYRYVIHDGPVCPPFLKNYVHRSRVQLDAGLMHRAAQQLLGTHDFRCFETKYPNKSSSVRTIMDVSIRRQACWQPWTGNSANAPDSLRESTVSDSNHDFIVLEIMADGFLYNMVRAIVGTLTDIGRSRNPPEDMARIVDSMDRKRAGMTAPATGLYLVQVEYPEVLLQPGSGTEMKVKTSEQKSLKSPRL